MRLACWLRCPAATNSLKNGRIRKLGNEEEICGRFRSSEVSIIPESSSHDVQSALLGDSDFGAGSAAMKPLRIGLRLLLHLEGRSTNPHCNIRCTRGSPAINAMIIDRCKRTKVDQTLTSDKAWPQRSRRMSRRKRIHH